MSRLNIYELKLNEKIDIYDRIDSRWYIGTVRVPASTYCQDDATVTISLDGFKNRWWNVSSSSHPIAKLHTHTVIHYYQNNQSADICIDGQNRKMRKHCNECMKKCCWICNLCIINKQYYCGKCVDKVQYNNLYKVTLSSLNYIISNQRIIECITQYSIGLNYNCCNDFCENEILFNNPFDFEHNKDIFDDKIYKYYIQKQSWDKHKNEIEYQYQMDYDNFILRIFCSTCNKTKLNRCSMPICKNKDVSSSCCYNHPLCSICKAWPNKEIKHKCKCCGNTFCSLCGIIKQETICKKCESSNAFKRYKFLIYSNIGDIVGNDITNIIASFCTGDAVNCCTTNCENWIGFNGEADLNGSVDYEGREIFYYHLFVHKKTSHFKTFTLYNKYGRIFCADCTKNKLNECKWARYFESSDDVSRCSAKDTDEMCKKHTFCGAGGETYIHTKNGNYYIKKCDYDQDLYEERDALVCIKCCKVTYGQDVYSNYSYWNYYDFDYYYYYGSDDEPDHKNIKVYSMSKDEHRQNRYLFSDIRYKMKNNKYNKKGNWKTKKRQKKKSYIKRVRDKQSNYESNKQFKKRHQLSLQW